MLTLCCMLPLVPVVLQGLSGTNAVADGKTRSPASLSVLGNNGHSGNSAHAKSTAPALPTINTDALAPEVRDTLIT